MPGRNTREQVIDATVWNNGTAPLPPRSASFRQTMHPMKLFTVYLLLMMQVVTALPAHRGLPRPPPPSRPPPPTSKTDTVDDWRDDDIFSVASVYPFAPSSHAPGLSSQSQASRPPSPPPPDAKDHTFTKAELRKLYLYRNQVGLEVDNWYRQKRLKGEGLYKAGFGAATVSIKLLKLLLFRILGPLPESEKFSVYRRFYTLSRMATQGTVKMQQGLQAMPSSPAKTESQKTCDMLDSEIYDIWKQVWAHAISGSTLQQIAEWKKRNKGTS